MKRIPSSHFQELYGLFTGLRTKKEVEQLLRDILTPAELADVAKRWQLVKLLAKGVPHRRISAELGISIVKVTRGAKALKCGHGGFKRFL